MAETNEATGLSEAMLEENQGGILVGISIAFIVLTSVILVLRFHAKKFQSPKFEIDDAFLIAAYIVNLAMCVIGIVIVYVGDVGRHVEAVERDNPKALVGWAKVLLGFEIVYFTSVALPKMSIVFLYLRIFNWRGTKRNIALGLQVLLAATSLSLVITACFQCTPIAFWWDRTIPGGRCIDVQMFFHAQAIPGFLLDLIIMALPLETIWHLKLPMIKRLALAGIFLVASFGIVASIIRARIFFSTAAFTDRTRASVDLIGWSIIETGTYIVTACLPHMRPLISHYTPAALKSWVRGTFSKVTEGLSSGSKSVTKSFAKRSRVQESDEVQLTTVITSAAKDGGKNKKQTAAQRDNLYKSTPPTRDGKGSGGMDDGSSWLGDASPTVSVRASVDVAGGTSGSGGGKGRSPSPTSPGQITVTREIKLTREKSQRARK